MSRKIKKRSGRSRARTRPPRKVVRRGKQQAQAEESSCDRSQLSYPLSSADLDCILQLTGIPEEFRYLARLKLDIDVHLLATRNWDRDDHRREQLRAAAKKIARIIKDLGNAIYEAQDLLPSWFQIEWAPDGYEGDDGDSTIDLFGLMSILDDFGAEFERLASPPTKQVANRPPGTVQSPALSFLIDLLYKCIVEEGHGELTVWKNDNRELKGTLPSVLKILRDRLPDKVPANPSYGTLRRYISRAKRKSVASRPSI
jgi:hypothetical protein